MIEINMGTTDRILRVLLGLLLVYIALYSPLIPWQVWTLAIVGLGFIVMSVSGVCPIYKATGKSTYPKG